MEAQKPQPEKDQNKDEKLAVAENKENEAAEVEQPTQAPETNPVESNEAITETDEKETVEEIVVSEEADDVVEAESEDDFVEEESKTDSEEPEDTVAEDSEESKEIADEVSDEAEETTDVDSEESVDEGSEESEEASDEESEEDEKSLGENSEETEESEEVINYEELDREHLVALLEKAVQIEDVNVIKQKVALLKVNFLRLGKALKEERLKAFIDEGGAEEDFEDKADELEEKFNLLFDIYKQNKAKYNAQLEELKTKNLELKKQVLEDLKELINSEETLKRTYDEFNVLQDRWKEIGVVPQTEINNLWQNYHFLVEMFFDKVKINKELRDLDLKKNLEQKIELCEKAEELLLETSIIKSFKELQKYHDQWKEIGPVPRDQKDEIWDRFKAATDKINERRKDYYNNIHETQKQNLEQKTALCEKADELAAVELKTVKDWQAQTDKINELMEIWRGIGPAPKKHNDEIWDRFKGSLNGFFDNKKEFFNALKQQQLENYNKKIELCVKAEAIKDSDDWQKTTNDLISLQKEWKTIGPVPKKYSDKVWKRFRAACDEFFNRKSEFYSHAHEREADNLEAKKELIEKIRNFDFGDDKNENLKYFKDFQREWMDIGHVPIKEKDKIQKEFRKVLDDKMNKLKIEVAEVDAVKFKAKFENLKDTRESRNMLYRERNFLVNKINKIKDDIILWENNMGFFAQSKNADLLKEEFEKKIKKAKNEVKILEAKVKVLNNTELE